MVPGFLLIDAWVTPGLVAIAFASCSDRRTGTSEGICEDGADCFGKLPRIVKLLLQLGDRGAILFENHTTQHFQFRILFDLGSAVAKS